MYVLHYAPDNASLVVRLALEEAGAVYRTSLVERRSRAQARPEYLALNPAGLIPALETPDGPLAETGACLLYLGLRHEGLLPAPGAPGWTAALRILFFLSNTLHADLRLVFYPEAYAGADPKAGAALHDGATARIARHLHLLEAEAAPGGPLDTAPALGYYLAACLRWAALYARHGTGWLALGDTPALGALLAALEARPATRNAARAEGLGAHPFTRPALPNPPEGSPT